MFDYMIYDIAVQDITILKVEKVNETESSISIKYQRIFNRIS